MNKVEFANIYADKKDLNKKDALETVEGVFKTLTEVFDTGEEVSIYGFGKFEVKERAERNGVNPSTGEKIVIPASKTVKFKPAKALKDLVNE